jgi:LPXTG-site transpeptidase (sortase) family protein
MARRFLLLASLCVLLGLATQAFGADAKQAPWITREGAVAMLVESKPEWKAELDAARADPSPLPIYVDTDPGEWYVPYLEVAFAHGIIQATDFHREFHPGELLRQGDAMVLAVRYKAGGDASKLPTEEPDHPMSVPLHVQKGYDMGLKPPSPFQSWDVIRRSDWIALAQAAGVPNAAAIVVTIPPKTVPAPASPQVQPLPIAGPVDPSVLQPVAQPAAAQPTTGYKPVTQPVTYVPPAQPTYAQPTYVPNPPGSQPVSSDQPAYVPTQTTGQPAYVPNPPNAHPVSSDGGSGGPDDFDPADYPSPADPNDGYFAIGIPSLGINDLKISHPTDVSSQAGLLAPLQSGVGHLFSYPGNGGTVLVYGHSSSYSWDVSEYTKIFRKINALKPGDKVYIAYGGKTYTYQVTFSQTVAATDMSAYQKNNGEELILYTCWPPDDVKQRYLVHAKPV